MQVPRASQGRWVPLCLSRLLPLPETCLSAGNLICNCNRMHLSLHTLAAIANFHPCTVLSFPAPSLPVRSAHQVVRAS